MNKIFYFQHHKQHLKATFDLLTRIFRDGTYADKAFESTMYQNKTWKGNERGFVAGLAYDIIRFWRLYTTAADQEINYSDKFWNCILAAWLIHNDFEIPEDKIFEKLPVKTILERLQRFKTVRKIWESVPDWIDTLCEQELGKDWDKILHAMNEPAPQFIRANTLKTSVRDLQRELSLVKIETMPVDYAPSALQLTFTRNVFNTDAFRSGLFEMQDAASQKVSEYLRVLPGQRVVDACAGAGGKTLHLAALMNNKGRILALDTEPRKLEELKKRYKRAGVAIIETRVIDTTKVIKRMYGTADRLLLDVPCSGLGVLRRNPDTKWRLQPEEIERLKKTQADILQRYAPIVKPGGFMVYATCSILPSEGEAQIMEFMKNNGANWLLAEEQRYGPHTHNSDGFYIALLKRNT